MKKFDFKTGLLKLFTSIGYYPLRNKKNYLIQEKFRNTIILTCVLTLTLCFNKVNAQGVDVVFVLDTSSSIDNTEYTNMKNTVNKMIDEVIGCSSYNRAAIVSYGSPSTNKNEIYIESDFTNNTTTLKDFPRRYFGPYDNTSEAIFLVNKALLKLADSDMLSPTKNLNFLRLNKVVIFLFTDSEYQTTSGYVSTLLNLRSADLYKFYNELKSNYLLKPEIVVVRSSINDVTKDNLANTGAAAIATIGGNYTGTVANNNGDPQGNGVKPRKFTYTTDFILSNTDFTNVKNQICRSCAPVVTINENVPSSQTVCLNSTPRILQLETQGTGTITYQWYRNTRNSTTGSTLITGANSPTYSPPTNVAGTLYYYAIVSDSSCDNKTTSQILRVTTTNQSCNCITTAEIQQNLNNQIVCSLDSATPLAVKATGSGTLTYQWYINNEFSYTGSAIKGANGTVFQPSGFHGDVVYYYYEVTDSNCNTKSFSPIYTLYLDSDGDTIPNYIDLDSDNDGISDQEEGAFDFYDKEFKVYNGGSLTYNTAFSINLQFIGEAGTKIKVIGYNKSEFNYIIPSSGFLEQSYNTAGIIPPKTDNTITQIVKDDRFMQVIADKPIQVIQRTLDSGNFSEDNGVLYPKSLWGKKYTLPGYTCLNCIGGNRNLAFIFTELTGVNVVVKDKNAVVIYDGPLNKNEILSLAYNSDMSGYTVEANKDVGVKFIVNVGTAPYSTADHMFEYLLPDRLLGRTFLTKSPGGQSKIIFVSTQDNTVIKRNGVVVQTLPTKGTMCEAIQNTSAVDLFETDYPVQAIKITPYGTIGNVNSRPEAVRDPSISPILDITKASLGPAMIKISSVLTRENHITIYVNTKDKDKITYNGSLIPSSSFIAFSADPNLSHATISVTANQQINIFSTTGKVPFITDYYGVGLAVSNATSFSIGPYDLRNGMLSNLSLRDTDGDGIPDYLDLDSDNDGCVDAIEGSDNVSITQLVDATSCLSAGIGSSASNKNLCSDSSCIERSGIPSIVSPSKSADIDNLEGQGVGTSNQFDQQDPNCFVINGICYKLANTTGTSLSTSNGISALRNNSSENWPMERNGGFMALESKTKGFVINRIASTAALSNITNPVEGMMVYDEEAKCIKVYTLKESESTLTWHCMTSPACPD